MKKISTLLILVVVLKVSFAQQSKFSKIYFDISTAFSADGMVKSYDGGLIVTGIYNYSSTVMKIDSTGTIVWAYNFGLGQNESVNAIVRTTDSCYVMTGKTYDPVSNTLDIILTKLDQSGIVMWSKVVNLPGNQESFAIAQTNDDGFIITGNESYTTPPHSRILVSKLDSLANVEWCKVYEGGNNGNFGNSVKQTPDGGYAVVGYVEDYPPFDGNGLLMKLSSLGNVEWANKYNTIVPTVFTGNDLVVASDGIYSYFATANEHAIIKTDFNGNDFWSETLSGGVPGVSILNTVTSKIKLLPDGNLIFATGSKGFASMSSIVCIDSTGNFNWSQYIYNSVHDIEQADDHGFFMLGNGPLIGVRTSSIINPHVGIIKSDSLGNADLCTSVNPTVSVNFGTITHGTLTLTVIPYSALNSSLTLVNSNVLLSEQVSCVDILGGVEINSDAIAEIYPNPNSSAFNLILSSTDGNVLVEILDVTGKEVYSHEYTPDLSDKIIIDHSLSPGMYYVNINSKENHWVKKIIVGRK